MEENAITRRVLVKSSVLGLLAAAIPNVLYARDIAATNSDQSLQGSPHDRYPAIRLDIASEVVGVSHFNLNRLKELVDPRPELAKANWDWGFGDWESAIGAASHTGRKDIIEYLISKGAVPTIFTYATLGAFDAVKAMIDFYPGIQTQSGPHGISLLQHAKLARSIEGNNKTKAQQMISYLEGLGNPDGIKYLPMAEIEKEKFIGDYKYGDGKDDGFTVKLNMKKLLALGKLGKSGGSLYRISENEFTYNGAPSVIIKFNIENDKVLSMTVNEPGLILQAVKF